MSKEQYCPECGTRISDGERFCPNCGTEVQDAPEAAVQETETGSKAKYFGDGSRTNIAGGLTQHQESHHTVNTSHVDNSQTIHNTTIIKDEVEYCEVCGNALEERRARCPKCGKIICMDCRVPRKNRCLVCEEKAENEYRISVRELLLSTGGRLDNTSRNLLGQKARELNLTDKSEQIIQDAMGAQAATQQSAPPQSADHNRPAAVPAAAPSPTVTVIMAPAAPVAPAVNPAPASRPTPSPSASPSTPASEKGRSGTALYALLAVIILAGILWFAFAPTKDTTPDEVTAPEETSLPAEEIREEQPKTNEETTPSAPATKAQKAIQASSASSNSAASNSTASSSATGNTSASAQATDDNYEAGMTAYKAGDGLSAVQSFEKSGSAQSNYMLGVIYEKGCGSVGANAMKAKKYYKKAASQGSTEAKAKL